MEKLLTQKQKKTSDEKLHLGIIGMLILVLSTVADFAFYLGSIDSSVAGLGNRMTRMESQMDNMDGKIDSMGDKITDIGIKLGVGRGYRHADIKITEK